MKTRKSIIIKSSDEIKVLREAGRILAEIMRSLKQSLTSGMTTRDVDAAAEELIRCAGVKAAFKGYRGFPASACVSVNEGVVHGIPGERVLRDGNIVSVDVGIFHEGFYSDMAFTAAVGQIHPNRQKLIDVTQNALHKGIEQAKPKNRLSDISWTIQNYVEAQGFSVVRDFVGHGIGRNLHEDPEIPNYGQPGRGPVLEPGMVLAIEPMVNMGTWKTKVFEDGWTVVTQDGMPSAHFEHTIAVTDNGPEILTKVV